VCVCVVCVCVCVCVCVVGMLSICVYCVNVQYAIRVVVWYVCSVCKCGVVFAHTCVVHGCESKGEWRKSLCLMLLHAVDLVCLGYSKAKATHV
jgi:hypothetical protein